MKLATLNKNLFAASSKNDEKVGQISRNDLIASGRLCAAEYMGNHLNVANNSKQFTPTLDKEGYAALSKGHWEKKLLFCAAKACEVTGRPVPANYDEVVRDASFAKDPIFMRTMAAIDREIITPLFYATISDVTEPLMQWSPAAMGRTKEIIVRSNEAFLFEDSAFGAGRSTSLNYAYNDTITLTPKPYTCQVKFNWYQEIAVDGALDAGYYYAMIMRGLSSKIMAKFTAGLKTAAANTAYVPSYLKYTGYNTANWGNATTKVAAANGVRREGLFAYGSYQALSKVLPSGTAVDAALVYGQGSEWFRNGFIGMVNRVQLIEVLPSIVPGTVNTTGTTIFPTDTIYIAARASDGLAPMHGVYAEGSPITVEWEPHDAADFSMTLTVTAYMDFAAVMASKIAVISSIS